MSPQRGRQLWAELHLAASFDLGWLARVNCGDCRTFTSAWIAANPPTPDFFEWGWRLHCAVNAKLGKSVVVYFEIRPGVKTSQRFRAGNRVESPP